MCGNVIDCDTRAGNGNGKVGIAFYNNVWLNDVSEGSLTDWVVLCGKNGGNIFF